MLMFNPINIGSLELKNRLVFPPLTTSFEEKGGIITPKTINFYRTLAKCGAGLIVLVDVSAVAAFSKTPTLHNDALIEGHMKLTNAVHEEDCKIAAQIFYPEVDPDIIIKEMKTSGMAVAMKLYHRLFNEYINEVEKEQIQRIQSLIAEVALRAKKAGYDMLQLHGDRLVGMFLSPILNKRTDEYGGSFENRARFVLETMDKIKAVVPDMPIEFKLSIIRMNPRKGFGGPTLEEAKILVKWLEEKGINSFHVALANHGALIDTIPTMANEDYACFLDLAEEIKKVATVPVCCVGRIVRPEMVTDILESGKSDMVALGRQLVADPYWPQKVKEGREKEIRYCLMCNKGCTDNLLARGSIACSINPTNGMELEPEIKKAEMTKNVLVIGGGIAGLEAARIASIRGHKVTVLEKSNMLFGQINLAMMPPNKAEMDRIREFYLNEIERLKITVKLNYEATVSTIKELGADEVIVATGAEPVLPKFEGIEKMKVVTAWDILSGKEELHGRVAIIGAGAVGVETAEFIGAVGFDAFVVELSDKILNGENLSNKDIMLNNLKQHNISIYTSHKLLSIEEKHINVEFEGNTVTMPCDMVVVAIGARPQKSLALALNEENIKYHLIGDCKLDNVRLIGDAVRDGFEIGNII